MGCSTAPGSPARRLLERLSPFRVHPAILSSPSRRLQRQSLCLRLHRLRLTLPFGNFLLHLLSAAAAAASRPELYLQDGRAWDYTRDRLLQRTANRRPARRVRSGRPRPTMLAT